jgi:hypothetical protein
MKFKTYFQQLYASLKPKSLVHDTNRLVKRMMKKTRDISLTCLNMCMFSAEIRRDIMIFINGDLNVYIPVCAA